MLTRMSPSPRWFPAALALALALSSIPARGAPLEATRVTLANGMKVVLAPDSLSNTVDAALWFAAGTRHETPAQAGVALLAARLTFRNGAADPQAPLEDEGGGGLLSVTPDYTCVSATVPSEALGQALQFLGARMPAKPVTAAQLAAERSAVRAERTRSERTPVARGLARLWNAAWPGHPYAQTGAPPSAGSDALKPADVEAWRKARYAPANAVLTLAGGFDPEQALAAIKTRFAGAGGAAPARAAAKAPVAAKRASERIDSPARLCFVGWRGPGSADPDGPALELLASWLGDGAEAKLTTSLVRDWNLAVAAQAGYAAQQDGSLLWTLAVVQPGADSAAVERTLLDAAKTVSERAPEAHELERARRRLESAVWFGLQTSRQRGQALGEAELLAGNATVASRRLAALDKVTPADLQRVAARVMTDAGRATVWMLPAGAGASR